MSQKTDRHGGKKLDDYLFDDCPVCQAMKRADETGRKPTLSELKEAFQEAKDQGAIVGGEWFDEKPPR